MLTERQEKILFCLVEKYIDTAEPISSSLLNQKYHLGVSPATIRNELQGLEEKGYITQPHTSAGRVPTNKAYEHFINAFFGGSQPFPVFIMQAIEEARQKVEKELQLARELEESFAELSLTLSFTRLENKGRILEILEVLVPAKTGYEKNMALMKKLLEELENF